MSRRQHNKIVIRLWADGHNHCSRIALARRSHGASLQKIGKTSVIGLRSTHMLRDGLHSILLAALVSFFSTCHAQSVAEVQETGGDVHPLSVTTCVACHGAFGEGTAGGGPRLAGNDADYLAHALATFKAGTRANGVMQAVALELSDSEIHELATFFSQQNPPLAAGAVVPSRDMVIAGRELAESGAGPDVPACFSCHGAVGKGNGARFPAIAGEPAAFVVARLHEFQARAKEKPPALGTMTAVAVMLNDTQIEEAAAYLSVTKP
jgi:cytochrome c553